MTPKPTQSPRRRELSLGRRLLFAAVATVLALGLLELGLRAAGFEGSGDRTTTWFSDHILLPPLWHERSLEEPALRYMSRGQSHHFHPFPVEKADDAFRVAVFGGSAAHGYGVLEPGAFPHRLEQILQRSVPDREIQVINLGTVAWSSQQILWAARQLWDVGEWDLVIIYSGHNELLELASWKTYMSPGEHRRYTRTLLLNQRLQGLRLYRVLRKLLGKGEPPPLPNPNPEPEDPTPTDPNAIVGGQEEELTDLAPGLDPVAITPAMRLDGMNPVPREERAKSSPLDRRYAARTYSHNIGTVIDLAEEHGTPVVLMAPAPNDFHDPAFFPYPGEKGQLFADQVEAAESLRGSPEGEAAARAALDLFPSDPRAHFLLGHALLSLGRNAEALPHFIEARRNAEYPNRVVPEVSEAIRSLESHSGVLEVIDIEGLFRSMNPDGFIDYKLVYDHCHPSVAGNWVIAGEVARTLLSLELPGLVAPADPPIDTWVQAGQDELADRRAPDPRLGEWTGLSWSGGQTEYIADFQGDWRAILERQAARVEEPDATTMDWLWRGNGLFYAYDLEAALDAWEHALRMDLGFCLAHTNKAQALRLVGARKEALVSAEAAVRCDPSDSEALAERDLLRRLKAGGSPQP